MLDEKTYADALTRRADMLYHIAKTILVSDDDCRDALQDAALRGWEKRWAAAGRAAVRRVDHAHSHQLLPCHRP